MKFVGKIKDIGRTLGGNLTITLESPCLDTAEAMELAKISCLDVEIKKQKRKRSRDANAYYWKLASKLAESLYVSKPYLHNYLLRKYGQFKMMGGKCVYVWIPDTDEAQKDADEDQTDHLKPTSQVQEGEGGTMYRMYMMLKGSSEYDTKEMSHLIDGLVGECREMGIETLPPEELERMMAAYGKRHDKK